MKLAGGVLDELTEAERQLEVWRERGSAVEVARDIVERTCYSIEDVGYPLGFPPPTVTLAVELTRYLLDDEAPDAWVLEELDGETARLRV